jgi:archaemetzincin
MTPQAKIRMGWLCIFLLLANIGVIVYLYLTPKKRIQPTVVTPEKHVTPKETAANGSAFKTPPATGTSLANLRSLIPTLTSLHEKIHAPGPSDWLAKHKEPGQTFEEYLTCEPVTLKGSRRMLYIQPLGELTGRRKEIVDLSAEFMGLYFGTDCRIMEPLPLSLIPESKRRPSRGFGEQIKTDVVLDEILRPRLPKDAAAYIAFTAADLYPEDAWNFVFGQAYLYHRVGVWSLARFGDPDADEDSFRLCLLRTIKTATHETGHMFSINHCTLYECNMDGSNHLQESDAKPLWLCPECFAKVLFATGQDAKESLRKQAAFANKHGLKAEAEFYEKSVAKLEE